ncbi:RNA polymerase sigma factor [Novosphingobium sp.]|uniref:RNA polymerase sigma factor n=1 Tax=Novosphingobium sp. TaxID=1874826 RepID=UPI003BA8D458
MDRFDYALARLLCAAAAGDKRAFRALYEATNRRLHTIALRIVGNPLLAEDVTQETYVRVWTQARQFDPAKGAAMAWLSRITRNAAIDLMRRNRRPMEDIADHADHLASLPDPVIERLDMFSGFSRLPEKQREVLTLALIYGYTHEELAAVLRVPIGTTKARMRRGVRQLRVFFDEAALTS